MTQANMACPIDGATLVMSERQGIEIDYCGRLSPFTATMTGAIAKAATATATATAGGASRSLRILFD